MLAQDLVRTDQEALEAFLCLAETGLLDQWGGRIAAELAGACLLAFLFTLGRG